MRVRVDGRVPLRRRIALAVVRPANEGEFLREQAEVEGMHCHLAGFKVLGVGDPRDEPGAVTRLLSYRCILDRLPTAPVPPRGRSGIAADQTGPRWQF